MTVDEAPTRLDAKWDAGRSAGRLIVAWQHPQTRLIAPVGLLEHGGAEGYRFRYLRRAAELEGFEPFLSFPEWDGDYTDSSLFPMFAQRIMSPRRPDFTQFLSQLDLNHDATPWEQLARSEGRSNGDTVQVFPIPAVSRDGTTTCRFLAHGVRYINDGVLPALTPGDMLTLRREPENPKNADAVWVCTGEGQPVGYVPDLLLEHLRSMQSVDDPILTVEHVNGQDVPAHLRLLVRLDGRVPPGYQPMKGARWETFSE